MVGKVALVTGGSRGIGRGICLALAAEGAKVIVNYVQNERAAKEVVEAIEAEDGEAIAVQADVSDRLAVLNMVEATRARFGRIDILVNNAGIQIESPFLDMSEEVWDRVIDVNLKGIFLCSQAVARVMVKSGGGKIINITSLCGEQVWSRYASYTASKGGANMLTKAMAVELAPYGINVNGIAPGSVETDMLKQDLDQPGEIEATVQRTPSKRVGQPEDIARAAVFLCSTAADWMVGEIITIDGGYGLVGDPIVRF